ncbi:MAG: TonB-dependent receptor [Bacteroidetes bacterium]|nr:TonB-dependent receptor [Bacteroidota bacterium]
MQRFINRLSVFILFSFISHSLLAQSLSVISGKVLNQKNEPVSGASVVVNGMNKKAAADVEGRFSIRIESGKKYTLTVTAVGFKTKEVNEVEVVAGEETVISVIMEIAAKEMGEVVIRSTAKKENTSGLLNFQRNNTSLSSGLSADFIRKTPDKNTGEVLRRVSGASIQDNKFVIVRGLSDRYNQALINGAQLPSSEPDKKAFSFDVIPSQLIDNIIINKTATPDLTGEFAGGLVQINTKDIPSRNQLIVGIGLGFNTQSVFQSFVSNPRGATDWLGFDRQRQLPETYPLKYGEYNKLSTGERQNIAASFNQNVWREESSQSGPIQSFNLTWANTIKGNKGGAFGSIIGVTYRNAKLLYNATKTLYEKDGRQAFFDYLDRQNRYSTNVGAVANFAWAKKKNKVAFKNLFNQLLEDNYYTRTGINTENLQDVSLRSSVLSQRTLLSSQLEGTHSLSNKIKMGWNLNYSFNKKVQPDLRVITYGRSIGTQDPFQINLRGNNTNRFFSNLTDHSIGGNGFLSYDFQLGKQKQTIKAGGSTTIRFRDFRALIFGYAEPSDLSLINLPFDQIFSSANLTKSGGFEMITALQNPQDKYFGISALSSGFLMLDNKLADKWRVTWGVRFENFEQFIKSNQQGTDRAVVVNTKQQDWLPSFNITYNPTTNSNLRLGASKTVARPEFREIAPFAFFDFEVIASTAGNPNLKRSSINNFDLRYEWYPKPGEVLSAGLFYKNFKNPIELRLNSASVATRRQYEFQNAQSAQLYGAEFEVRKNLSFIRQSAKWLDRLYFSGNVSVIASQVLLSNIDVFGNALAPTQRPLQGQSPYLVNAGFQYEGKQGTGFSLLYNRVGQRLALVGNADFGDIYERPRDLVDIQLTQKILGKKGDLRLTISDLFNQPIQTYENRDTPKAFSASRDKVFSSFTPGMTVTIAFTYDFDLNVK